MTPIWRVRVRASYAERKESEQPEREAKCGRFLKKTRVGEEREVCGIPVDRRAAQRSPGCLGRGEFVEHLCWRERHQQQLSLD